MGLAEGIRKHGFRKWYERELLQSHLHMLLLLFCWFLLSGNLRLLRELLRLPHHNGVLCHRVLEMSRVDDHSGRGLVMRGGSSAAVSSLPAYRTATRSATFFSSRTLPGH